MSFLKERLARTRQNIFGRLKDLITGKATDKKTVENIEEILIGSDISIETVEKILLKAEGMKVSGKDEDYLSAIRQSMISILSETPDIDIAKASSKPFAIMVVGVNGSGKTTTIGKLAQSFNRMSLKGVLGACDTFRAAAIEQLEIWGKKADMRVIKQKHGSDPASVAFDSLKAATASNADYLILDTAGRLHTKHNLMEELKKIKRVLQKQGDYPQETWIVLDATFGQNSLNQVKEFNDALSLTGIVVTKLDGTAKGGALLSIADRHSIPIRYIGVGEGPQDLLPFNREDFVNAIIS